MAQDVPADSARESTPVRGTPVRLRSGDPDYQEVHMRPRSILVAAGPAAAVVDFGDAP
jgi:hypothetical protein